LEKEYFDYFIFGHRHLPIDFKFENGSRYINLGDWIHYYSFAILEAGQMTLLSRLPEMEGKIVKK
jgi:UDP-2,3-diacylglucosamine hydrolase